ncbi:unnamed protein product [Brachionus calyciflorus]|uniref:Uncharacterized protein n=1 Tax=Brachionus calyciflorus TaxID=104777 RepID=A0A814S8Q6_9BILA|nr:unnamed protein product [Brachionus calyciflorus]
MSQSIMEYQEESILRSLPCESLNQEDLEAKQIKKRKLLEKLKHERFESMKGSSVILDKIKKQRESFESRIMDNKERIIFKQQRLVKQLNHENEKLIQENSNLKSDLIQANHDKEILEIQSQELNEQNECLKEQLKISQSYSIKTLHELKESKQDLLKLSRKISRK